jgi:hypothetical protein
MLLVLSFLEMECSANENIVLLNHEVHEMKRMIQSILGYVRANMLEFGPLDMAAVIRETITLLKNLTQDPAFAEVKLQYPTAGLPMFKGNSCCLQTALIDLLLPFGQSADRNNPTRIAIEASTDPSSQMHTIRIFCSGQSVHGQSATGQSVHGQSAFGQLASGQLAFGQSALNESIPLFSSAGEARFSLIQRAITLHKGTIQALNEHDGRLCFTITLPMSGC